MAGRRPLPTLAQTPAFNGSRGSGAARDWVCLAARALTARDPPGRVQRRRMRRPVPVAVAHVPVAGTGVCLRCAQRPARSQRPVAGRQGPEAGSSVHRERCRMLIRPVLPLPVGFVTVLSFRPSPAPRAGYLRFGDGHPSPSPNRKSMIPRTKAIARITNDFSTP